MKNFSFPWLALGLGLLVAGGLLVSGAFAAGDDYALPLLTMLVLSEFGFFVTAIGAGIGFHTLLVKEKSPLLLGVSIADASLAAMFLYLGIQMWPGNFSF